MKLFLFFVGISSVWAFHGQEPHICHFEQSEDGILSPICCPGWTGSENGCVTPVCVEACALQGGTCILPDTCQCPGGKVSQDCSSRSQCEEERENHEMLSWAEKRRTFKPTCLPDGSYTILQCDKVTRYCFCVDRWTGEKIVSTITRGVPDCEEYYVQNADQRLFREKEVVPLLPNGDVNGDVLDEPGTNEPPMPPCDLKHKEWEESTLFSLFNPEPQCAEDGYFVSHRCDYIFGYCVCLDRNTGEDIESTKVHSVNIDCTGVSLPEPEPEPTSQVFPEEGCVVGNTYHEQGQEFYRDCNMCTCHGYNVIQCTDKTCEPNTCYLGDTGKIIEHKVNGECYRCTCEKGVTDCSVVDCIEMDQVEEVQDLPTCGQRPTNSNFHDECNTCWCGGENGALCTLMGCHSVPGSCWVNGRSVSNGQDLTQGCDTIRCVDGQLEVVQSCVDNIESGMRFSGRKPKDACEYDDKNFYNGESMLYGSKLCQCRIFDWDCQPLINLMQ